MGFLAEGGKGALHKINEIMRKMTFSKNTEQKPVGKVKVGFGWT